MRYHEIITDLPNPYLNEASHPFRQVAASLTTENTGGDVPIEVLRQKVKNFLKQLQGKSYFNQSVRRNINITGVGIKKSPNLAGDDLLRLHFALPNILRFGIYHSIAPKSPKRPGMISERQ